MKPDIGRLLKSSLVYSGGSVVGKILTFCLLPLTTSYLTPVDYGIIGILAILPLLLDGLFSLGFNISVGRSYGAAKTPEEQQGVIWTATFALVLNCFVWTVLGWWCSPWISQMLLGTSEFTDLVRITFFTIGVCTVRLAFEFYLRAQEQTRLVLGLNLAYVLISIGSVITMVVAMERGAKGFVEAGAFSQTMNLLLILTVIIPQTKISWQPRLLPELIKVGAPFIYGLLGSFILQCSARYLLQLYTDEAEVGLFFLGSNFAKVIELPLWGFMSAWVPFFHKFVNRQGELPPVC